MHQQDYGVTIVMAVIQNNAIILRITSVSRFCFLHSQKVKLLPQFVSPEREKVILQENSVQEIFWLAQ
jgi:hypothetical protein